ncbi:MAG: glycosyltransferase [Sedimentisphaerales bacterium]|nr:glycosyltransferase [Sedimentisphaerales bacterium]
MFELPKDEIEASKDISVIVAIHDSPKITQRCLQSIEMYGANAEIILVDDSSQLQETTDLIRDYKQRNQWIVFRHEKSLGHSRSCEAGSRFATRPYLCFLNSDTVITPWSWRGIKEAFDSDPKIAVTGPTTSWTATKQKNHRAEYCRYYWTNSQIYAFAKKCTSKRSIQSLVDLPEVGGFAFFIRRSIWEEFGCFDSRLSDYGNETELCKRISEKGFRIVWTQNSYIHHFGQASYGTLMNEETMKKRRMSAQIYIDTMHTKNK